MFSILNRYYQNKQSESVESSLSIKTPLIKSQHIIINISNMGPNKVARNSQQHPININDSWQVNMGESPFLYFQEIESNSIFSQYEIQQEISDQPKSPETSLDDTDQYYQTFLSTLQFKMESCSFSNDSLQNIDNKSNSENIDFRLKQYYKGLLTYLSTLKVPIFGQNSKFDRTKRKNKYLGLFACIAKVMDKFKDQGDLDTDYVKRFDQRLQANLRLRAEQRNQERVLNLAVEALKLMNKVGENDSDLEVFQKKYNRKRHWAVLLKRMVNQPEVQDSLSDGSLKH